MKTPPPPPVVADFNKLKKEIGVFLIFFGVVVTVVGYWACRALDGDMRKFIFGVPSVALGILHLSAGVLLFVTSRKVWAIVGASATTLVVLLLLAFMLVTTGGIPLNLVTALIVVIPVGVWVRTSVFLKMNNPK